MVNLLLSFSYVRVHGTKLQQIVFMIWYDSQDCSLEPIICVVFAWIVVMIIQFAGQCICRHISDFMLVLDVLIQNLF